jgi:hypothetical protein
MARTSHDILDAEALCSCMEEDGVMWHELVAAARAAGTYAVEYMIPDSRQRSERAFQRLDEIELQKVSRWRSACVCPVSWSKVACFEVCAVFYFSKLLKIDNTKWGF